MPLPVHKVFISYHHAEDEAYRNRFETLFKDKNDVFINKSVEIGDIDTGLKTETIRQKIRDEYLRDSSVIVVLIGKFTWQRRHVDWEISSAIRDTDLNPRSGLLGIFLPSYPITLDKDGKPDVNPHTIPPRLYDNFSCGYAKLYRWSENHENIAKWIHQAFLDKDLKIPDNSRDHFNNNKTGDEWQ